MGEKKMLVGCDISRWNGGSAVRKVLTRREDVEFFICKATEGKTYRDDKFYKNIVDAIGWNKLIGAYHYARPENGNKPEDEAANFVNAVRKYVGNILMALDWEGEALKHDAEWALKWCNAVKDMTGVKPLLYVQETALPQMSKAFYEADYGLWVAKWSNSAPTTGAWPFWAIWQYNNSPFDLDKFNGDKEQFLKYCRSSTVENDPDGDEDNPHYCGCCCCRK